MLRAYGLKVILWWWFVDYTESDLLLFLRQFYLVIFSNGLSSYWAIGWVMCSMKKKNTRTEFLTDEGACEAVVGYTETTLPMQLRDLVRADQDGCFYTWWVRKHLFIYKKTTLRRQYLSIISRIPHMKIVCEEMDVSMGFWYFCLLYQKTVSPLDSQPPVFFILAVGSKIDSTVSSPSTKQHQYANGRIRDSDN